MRSVNLTSPGSDLGVLSALAFHLSPPLRAPQKPAPRHNLSAPAQDEPTAPDSIHSLPPPQLCQITERTHSSVPNPPKPPSRTVSKKTEPPRPHALGTSARKNCPKRNAFGS